MLLAGTHKKNVLCFLLLSFAAYLSQPLRSSQRTEGELSGCFQDLCTLSLHRRQGEGTGVFTEHTSKGWETEGLVEIILKMGFYGSNCRYSLHSSYNLEKDIKLHV